MNNDQTNVKDLYGQIPKKIKKFKVEMIVVIFFVFPQHYTILVLNIEPKKQIKT